MWKLGHLQDNCFVEKGFDKMVKNYKNKDQRRIKKLKKKLKKTSISTPVDKYIYLNREINLFKKKNQKNEKIINGLKKLNRINDDKIRRLDNTNEKLAIVYKGLLKSKSEYHKLLGLRESENRKYKTKIKGLKNYIAQIKSEKVNNYDAEDLKDLKKWNNDRGDLVEAFLVAFLGLKEKLMVNSEELNIMKKKIE